MILLSVYGMGFDHIPISFLTRLIMKFSYLRASLEGIMVSMLFENKLVKCPETEDLCIFPSLEMFINWMGFRDSNYLISMLYLLMFFSLFRIVSYIIMRQRLRPGRLYRNFKFIIGSMRMGYGRIRDKIFIDIWVFFYRILEEVFLGYFWLWTLLLFFL